MESENSVQTSFRVKVPWFVCDEEFVRCIKEISADIEVLDCSECAKLTQEAFLQLSREEITFQNLKHLIVPENSPFPDLVYECLSYITPALERLTNLRQNTQNTCDQLRCLSYFKKSNMKVLQDNPVACYGRMSSQSDKQRRQKWEQDLAKIAINCQKMESYRCHGGKGYMDDKSLERLSVLMPGLIDLELRRCSVSDEGIQKFFTYNKSCKVRRIVLDDAGTEITDRSLKIISENCPNLSSLILLRLEKLSKNGVELLTKNAPNLLELELGVGQCRNHAVDDQRYTLDEVTFQSVLSYCMQLRKLSVHFFDLTFKNVSKHVLDVNAFSHLKCLSFYDCQLTGSNSFVEFLAQLQNLSDLSFVDCRSFVPEVAVNLIVKLPFLKRLTLFCQHKGFYSDVAPIAKDAYTMLTSENGGRFKLSSVEHLSVQGVSGQFLRLLTALCSQIISLDFRLKMLPRFKNSCLIDCIDLVEAISPCDSLTSLEVVSMNFSSGDSRQCGLKPKLNDNFFSAILNRLPRINKLCVDFNLEDVSKYAVFALLKNATNLEHLTLNIANCSIDEASLQKALDQLGRKCYTMSTSSVPDSGSLVRKMVRLYLKPHTKDSTDKVPWIKNNSFN